MGLVPFPRWTLFLASLFWQLGLSSSIAIPIARIAALSSTSTIANTIPLAPTAIGTSFALLSGDGNTERLSSSTFTYTSTSSVVTSVDGHLTTSPVLITGTSVTLVPAPTGAPEALAAPPHSAVNPGLIAGPICAAVVILGIVLWLIIRRRKAALGTKIFPGRQIKSTEGGRSPFDSPFDTQGPDQRLSSSSTVSIRQQYISNQVNMAREKVRELEEMSTLLRYSSDDGMLAGADVPHTAAVETPLPTNNSGTTESLEDKLQRAIEQIETLNTRIQEMERQRRSSWALGLSDEPPPGYME